ncbi:MAG TPA: hypothetical protein VGK93_04835 [Candidatus Eisenbacteria bacterium]|jgi:hypothetical protein
MNSVTTPLRTWARGLAPLLGLLLATGWLTGGLHQHHDASGRHPCAVCSVNHSPAVQSISSAAPLATHLRGETLVATPSQAPRRIASATPSSRAPPAA